MARTATQTITATVPDLNDLADGFPHYVRYAEADGKTIFATVCTPLAVELATSATRNKLPAVAGVIELCEREFKRKGMSWTWDNFSKQFLGGLVRVLMTESGYKTTGSKRSIPHPDFRRGEFYEGP